MGAGFFAPGEDGRRRRAALVLGGILVAVLAGSTTMAYLTAGTGEADNTFGSFSDIEIEVVETDWNPQAGKRMLPGTVIPKSVAVHNKTEHPNFDLYLGMRLTFQKAKSVDGKGEVTEWVDMTQQEAGDFLVGFGLKINEDDTPGISPVDFWKRGGGATGNDPAPKMLYFVDRPLPGETGDFTMKFTDFASISASAGNAAWKTGDTVTLANYMTWLHAAFPGGTYQVVFEGAAVQAQGIANPAQADTELTKLLPVS